MSRPSVQRSELAGWASYGYCASHSRYFWGLRLYLVCTPTGMPILWALANANSASARSWPRCWTSTRTWWPSVTGSC